MNADIKGEDVAMIVGAPLLVSSSGVEYDLVKVQNREVIDFPLLSIINQILVISAGVSEKTERQIDFALNDDLRLWPQMRLRLAQTILEN